MGALDFLLRRHKKELTETQKTMIYGVFSGESNRTISDREEASMLGINREMIRDEVLEGTLSRLCNLKDEDGNPMIDLNMGALAILATTPLIRTSFSDAFDAHISILESRRMVKRIELEAEEETFDYGVTNFYEALLKVIETGWNDSVNGKKAKLMKVTSKAMEVTVPEQQQKTQKSGIMP